MPFWRCVPRLNSCSFSLAPAARRVDIFFALLLCLLFFPFLYLSCNTFSSPVAVSFPFPNTSTISIFPLPLSLHQPILSFSNKNRFDLHYSYALELATIFNVDANYSYIYWLNSNTCIISTSVFLFTLSKKYVRYFYMYFNLSLLLNNS